MNTLQTASRLHWIDTNPWDTSYRVFSSLSFHLCSSHQLRNAAMCDRPASSRKERPVPVIVTVLQDYYA
jgi:hypothetical protein